MFSLGKNPLFPDLQKRLPVEFSIIKGWKFPENDPNPNNLKHSI